MFSEQSIRSFPRKAYNHAMASLGSALSMGILLELSRSSNITSLCDKADELILRGSCRLRKLQSAVPQIKIPELKLKLLPEPDQLRPLRIKIEKARLKANEELALAQALIELYLGMLLRLFTSQKSSPRTCKRSYQILFFTPRAWIPSSISPNSGIKQKRPILI